MLVVSKFKLFLSKFLSFSFEKSRKASSARQVCCCQNIFEPLRIESMCQCSIILLRGTTGVTRLFIALRLIILAIKVNFKLELGSYENSGHLSISKLLAVIVAAQKYTLYMAVIQITLELKKCMVGNQSLYHHIFKFLESTRSFGRMLNPLSL